MNLIKNYTEKISELETKRDDAEIIGNAGACICYTGEIETYKLVIEDLKKQALKDRFFLEEIAYKILNEENDHYETLVRDFLNEYVSNTPLTEFEREQYIENVLGFADANYYFKSEYELHFYLKNHRIPNKYDSDYSITDTSLRALEKP